MRKRMKDLYDYQYPIERRVIEDRLSFIEAEFNKFDYLINPFHIQPGLLLDLDITSIKRKKATLDGMANVLNEFLHGVSKALQMPLLLHSADDDLQFVPISHKALLLPMKIPKPVKLQAVHSLSI